MPGLGNKGQNKRRENIKKDISVVQKLLRGSGKIEHCYYKQRNLLAKLGSIRRQDFSTDILHVTITEVRCTGKPHTKSSKVLALKYTSIFYHVWLSGPGNGKYNLFCFADTLRNKGTL